MPLLSCRKMKSFNYTFLAIVLTLASCQSNDKDNGEVDFSESVTLQDGNVLVSNCDPVDYMVLCDSLLWIAGQDQNELLHVYDVSGKLLDSGMSIGQGGDDVLEVSSIRSINGKIYVYDSRGGVIDEVVCRDGKLDATGIVRDMRFQDDAFMLPDSSMLALPLNSSNAYVMLDSEGSILDSLSYFPPKPDGISDATHYLACTGKLAYSPADTTFARTVAYDGGIDFFAVKNGRISHTARYANFDMVYTTYRDEGKFPVPSDESRIGYSHVYATPDHFYASYSVQKCLYNPTGMSTEIHVFDHNGKPQYKMLFEHPIQAFAVSEDDAHLYVAEADNDDDTVIKHYILQSKPNK